jgi:hypothetical protein
MNKEGEQNEKNENDFGIGNRDTDDGYSICRLWYGQIG